MISMDAVLWVAVGVELLLIGALALSNIKLWIEHEAMKKSTHQLTYVDPFKNNLNQTEDAPFFDRITPEEEAALRKDPMSGLVS
jgi:hypothetical protein